MEYNLRTPYRKCQNPERLITFQHPIIAHIWAQLLSRQDNFHQPLCFKDFLHNVKTQFLFLHILSVAVVSIHLPSISNIRQFINGGDNDNSCLFAICCKKNLHYNFIFQKETATAQKPAFYQLHPLHISPHWSTKVF